MSHSEPKTGPGPPAVTQSPTLQQRLATGQESAFAELYDEFSARLYRTALAILGPGRSADAEDALQDVFMALVPARQSLARVENLAAYLATSVRRAAVRRRQRRTLVQLPDADAVAAPHAATEVGSTSLDHALAALPDEQREVLALKFEAGLTFAEIAQALDISANTAASRYRYALEKLRARLEQEPEQTDER